MAMVKKVLRKGGWCSVMVLLCAGTWFGSVSAKIAAGLQYEENSNEKQITSPFLFYQGRIEESSETLFGRMDFSLRLTNEKQDSVTIEVNRIYGKYEKDFFSFLIGKMRVKNSTGFAWCPADIINPTQLLFSPDKKEPQDEGEGIFMLGGRMFFSSLSLPVSVKGSVFWVPYPDEEMKKSKGFLIGEGEFFGVEVSFSWGRSFDGEEKENLYGGYGRVAFPGLDFLILYGEFANKDFSTNRQYLAGIQLEPRIGILRGNIQCHVEYFYNQDGYNSMEDFRNDFFQKGILSFPGMTLKNYVYTGMVYVGNYTRWSLGLIKNIDDEDGSGMINGMLKVAIGENGFLKIEGFSVFPENKEKEFFFLRGKKWGIGVGYEIYFGYGTQD